MYYELSRTKCFLNTSQQTGNEEAQVGRNPAWSQREEESEEGNEGVKVDEWIVYT
jgi:hypothetical protein